MKRPVWVARNLDGELAIDVGKTFDPVSSLANTCVNRAVCQPKCSYFRQYVTYSSTHLMNQEQQINIKSDSLCVSNKNGGLATN